MDRKTVEGVGGAHGAEPHIVESKAFCTRQFDLIVLRSICFCRRNTDRGGPGAEASQA